MITVEHLTKCYGNVKAVDDLSFEIGEGSVYGFLGPNGAGKSTTMNIMTGCLSATSGKVEIDGCDIFENPKAAKKLLGYLPEQPPLYLSETPCEYLRFVGEAKGLRVEELTRQIAGVIEETRIGDVRNRAINALSKGYRQRVGIAQALLGSPKTIILDEPTVGLDPLQIVEIRELIRSLGENRTVLLSSHILSEVQTMCSRILIIAHGRLVAFDEPDALEARLLAPSEITVTALTGAAHAESLVAPLPGVAAVSVAEESSERCTLTIMADAPDIYAVSRDIFLAFANHGAALCELAVKKANLEDIFLELTEDKKSAAGEAADGHAAVEEGGSEE